MTLARGVAEMANRRIPGDRGNGGCGMFPWQMALLARLTGLRHLLWLMAVLCLSYSPASAATLSFTVNTSEPVVVTGTPRIAIDVGGVTRYASYASGSGSSALTFGYAVQAGDFDANGITLASPLQLNGGSIADALGNLASNPVFTLPDTASVKVQTYTAAFTTSPITNSNATAVGFAIAKAPVGASFSYTITSSGGSGSVTGSGTIASSSSHAVSGVDVSALPSGTLTLSVTVSTTAGGTGAAKTATATPTFTGTLDGMSAAAAFSVRRLRSAYTGSLLRVRRSSDSTEQDISATVAGNLDTTTLTSFCGSASCYVRTWYDQSGNARDAVQATASAQPRIVNAGVVETNTALPALYFNGANGATYHLETATPFTTTYTLSAVASRVSSSSGPRRLLNIGGGSTDNYGFLGTLNGYATFAGMGSGWNDTSGNTPTVNVPANTPVTMACTNSLNVLTPYINGTAQNTKNGTTKSVTGLSVGGLFIYSVDHNYHTEQIWDGRVSEVIVYNTALSTAEVQSLQANQKTYYGTP